MKPNRFLAGKKPLIYLITEGRATVENFFEKRTEILEIIEIAVGAKIDLIQIREKNLPARLVFELASDAAQITRNTETRLLINDRADIALAARADGVHLTARSLISAEIIRANFAPGFIVGVSTHTLEEAEKARQDGADFVTFSPIFPTPAKEKYGAPQGLGKLRAVCERLEPFPVVALGGIDAGNYKAVLDAGARGFAAIRFLYDKENMKKLSAYRRTQKAETRP